MIPCAASAAQAVAVDDGRQILWGNHHTAAAAAAADAASTSRSLTPLRLLMWDSIIRFWTTVTAIDCDGSECDGILCVISVDINTDLTSGQLPY